MGNTYRNPIASAGLSDANRAAVTAANVAPAGEHHRPARKRCA